MTCYLWKKWRPSETVPNPIHLALALALCVLTGGLIVVGWGRVPVEF